ncbi:MAG: biotin transporter BioY [Clostridia bacterium]|nr:biotin transporter BioY [Clostridia bacterium]
MNKIKTGAKSRRSAAREIAYIALSVSLITVCAWISVPVAAIPVTLQTFAVALIGALMGWKRALAAVAAYLVMGLVGIPVFTGFKAGVATLMGATGGYIFGFAFLALLPALFKMLPLKNKWGRTALFYGASVLGMAICYLFGTAWFVLMYKCTFVYALTVCVVPYILPDAVKFVFSSIIAVRLEKQIK